MLRKEDFMVIPGVSQTGALWLRHFETGGGALRTVSWALARGGASATRSSRRGSRLDPYRAEIDRLRAEDIWNAVVIFRELQAQGCTGRLSILRDYFQPKRALRVRRGPVRVETAPGRRL